MDLEQFVPDLSEARRGLDVVLLHRVMLEKGLGITAEAVEAEKFIVYEREINKAIAAVDRGEAQMACLLKPVRVEQVGIALGGGVLPQKSTDFYPKLLSGETIYRIEESEWTRKSSNLDSYLGECALLSSMQPGAAPAHSV